MPLWLEFTHFCMISIYCDIPYGRATQRTARYFKHCVVLWYFKRHVLGVTYDNGFHVCCPCVRHASLSCSDKCGTSLSQIDFFFLLSDFSAEQKEKMAVTVLFCSCFATRCTPLSAIKQPKNKHRIGYRKHLHTNRAQRFLSRTTEGWFWHNHAFLQVIWHIHSSP